MKLYDPLQTSRILCMNGRVTWMAPGYASQNALQYNIMLQSALDW